MLLLDISFFVNCITWKHGRTFEANVRSNWIESKTGNSTSTFEIVNCVAPQVRKLIDFPDDGLLFFYEQDPPIFRN